VITNIETTCKFWPFVVYMIPTRPQSRLLVPSKETHLRVSIWLKRQVAVAVNSQLVTASRRGNQKFLMRGTFANNPDQRTKCWMASGGL